ncbi:uncharacterized protein IUM83_19622 [Phytophthora cinnamomi]|uniref:uncharacterized protein n=1 Tax=Phytophthora cinnamomi TaxID=4785 RepID=UPI003559E8FC|nr:hypothetical protein IUM83_19622 [Phytophthora cinnamomi]
MGVRRNGNGAVEADNLGLALDDTPISTMTHHQSYAYLGIGDGFDHVGRRIELGPKLKTLQQDAAALMESGLAPWQVVKAVALMNRDGARFMSFTQFKKRGSQTADEHILCLDTILDEFGLDAVDLVCLVGDNMNTNRCISKRTTVPFVGCAAHRLNLGVKAFIQAKGHQDDLKRFSSFMRKLRTVSRWAKLEEAGCPCNPEVLHDIRWTGAFDMIERYMKMRPFLVKFESDVDVDDRVPGHLQYEYQDKSVQELIPSAANHARLRELHEDLRVFAYATRQLQEPRLTIADVRDLFDMLIVRHGSLKEQLGAEAKAVVSTMFEHVLVKLQNKKTLTRAEAPFATCLLKNPRPAITTDPEPESSKPTKPTNETILKLQRDLKRKRELRSDNHQAYIDTARIPPTSVVVEQ